MDIKIESVLEPPVNNTLTCMLKSFSFKVVSVYLQLTISI